MLAQILDDNFDPAANVLQDRARDAHPTGLGDFLQTRGHIHAIAVYIAFFNDDVAKIDPNSELQRPGRILGCHAALPSERASDGIDDAWKLREEAVAHELDHAALVRDDQRLERFLAKACERRQRASLVFAHETRVTHNISGKNGS